MAGTRTDAEVGGVWVKRVRAAAVVVGLLLTACLVQVVYLDPRTDPVSSRDPADAVVALSGVPRSIGTARALVEQGAAPELVVSNGYGPQDGQLRQLCASHPSGYAITCFVPDPDTTRGEARAVGRLARDRGWDDLVLVTPTSHVSRSRLIVGRCYSGRLRLVSSPDLTGLVRRVYQVGYETTAFLKAAVLRGC